MGEGEDQGKATSPRVGVRSRVGVGIRVGVGNRVGVRPLAPGLGLGAGLGLGTENTVEVRVNDRGGIQTCTWH